MKYILAIDFLTQTFGYPVKSHHLKSCLIILCWVISSGITHEFLSQFKNLNHLPRFNLSRAYFFCDHITEFWKSQPCSPHLIEHPNWTIKQYSDAITTFTSIALKSSLEVCQPSLIKIQKFLLTTPQKPFRVHVNKQVL